MTAFTITSARGLKLAALYDQPGGKTNKYPLVILLHGNTGWKEEEHVASLAQRLAEAGIAALRFDAPGSGKSEGTWEKDYRASYYLDAVKKRCVRLCVEKFANRPGSRCDLGS